MRRAKTITIEREDRKSQLKTFRDSVDALKDAWIFEVRTSLMGLAWLILDGSCLGCEWLVVFKMLIG